MMDLLVLFVPLAVWTAIHHGILLSPLESRRSKSADGILLLH